MSHRPSFVTAVSRRSVSACPASAGAIRRRRAAAHRLHAGACRAAAPGRPDRLLGGGRHAGDHGGLDHHHRDLFRLPRRRADRAHRAPGRDAIRLRGSHRRPARSRSTACRAASSSIRSNTSRSSTRSCGGSRRWKAAPTPSRRCRIRSSPARPGRPDASRRDRCRTGRRRSTTSPRACCSPERASRPRHRRRERARAPAGVARSRRGAAGGVARPRWKRATTPRRGASAACWPISASTPADRRARQPAIGGPLVRGAAAGRRRLVRAPRSPHQPRARAGRPPDAHARLGAGAQAGHGRDGSLLRLRHAHRSVHPRAGHAHRNGFSRRHRRPGARHRRRQRHGRRLERRLRQDGRDRSRQRADHALRRICPTSASRSGSACGPARSSARSARPAARPGRICTTRRA